jgi:hypothetical protein
MRTGIRYLVGIASLIALIALWWAGVGSVYADCRWVRLGADSYWICDEDDTPAEPDVSMCQFRSDRSRHGNPGTVTVFCRSDGSIWKEIVVRPRVIVLREFGPDGALTGERRFGTASTPDSPSGSSMTEASKVTKRIVPDEPIARMEPPRPTNRIVQAVPVVANEQEEPRKHIERAKPRTPQKRRRPSRPQPQWVSQRFGTSVMGSRIKGTFERRGDDVRGVVYVYPPFGGKNTYHFTGKIQGNRVVASHHSGHVFRGEIVGGNRVVGVVTSRGGTRIPLDVPVGLP